MAAAAAKYFLHTAAELFQQIHGHEGLYRSGEAAAMDTVCALTAQQRVAHGQCQRHFLMVNGACRSDVLQIHPGAASRFPYRAQEPIVVAIFQSLRVLRYPLLLLLKMEVS